MAVFFWRGLFNVVAALSLTGWVSYARLVRDQSLSLQEREFVRASGSLGARDYRLMVRHILPNTLSPLAVQAALSPAAVIIAEAGLSFLGLGVSQNHVSWGGVKRRSLASPAAMAGNAPLQTPVAHCTGKDSSIALPYLSQWLSVFLLPSGQRAPRI